MPGTSGAFGARERVRLGTLPAVDVEGGGTTLERAQDELEAEGAAGFDDVAQAELSVHAAHLLQVQRAELEARQRAHDRGELAQRAQDALGSEEGDRRERGRVQRDQRLRRRR